MRGISVFLDLEAKRDRFSLIAGAIIQLWMEAEIGARSVCCLEAGAKHLQESQNIRLTAVILADEDIQPR